MKQYFNANIFWYLSILLPFTFAIGIAVTELFALIIILFFLYKNRNFYYFTDIKFLYLIFFSIYISINASIQISDNDLKFQSFFHFRFAILAVSILFILDFFKDKIYLKNYLLLFAIFVSFLIIIDALIQYFVGQNIFGYEIIRNRISGIFGPEFILGSFLIRILPLIVWLIFFYKFKIKKNQIFLCIFFSLYFITIYVAGERSAFISLLIFLFFSIIFLIPLRKLFVISTVSLILFIILTSFIKIGKSDPTNRMFIKTFNQIQTKFFLNKDYKINLKDDKLSDQNKKFSENLVIFSTNHNGHYVLAYHLFKDSPIFGKGPEGFRSYCREVKYNSKIGICSTHPHNILLQILSELGIFGFAFYLFGILFVLLKIFKIHKKNDTNYSNKFCFLSCSIAIIINLFPFLPSGNIFNNWMLIINYYYFGLYLFGYNELAKL